MKILLIDPPFYRFIGYYNRYFPLGLAYLASVLRKAGHEVLIYDADCNKDSTKMDFSFLEESYPDYIAGINNPAHKLWQEAKEILLKEKPDLVGISTMTTKIASAFRLAEICKSYNINMPVVMGGPHPTLMPEEVLNNSPAVDMVMRGEGEISIVNMVNALENNISLENVKGISFRKKGKIIHNQAEDQIMDLDSLPLPARDLLWGKDTYTSEDMGLMFASRACPFNCTFCSSAGVWGRITRYRSIENIIMEIKEVQERYGTVQFSFKDDTFTLKRQRVIDFCSTLKKESIRINWDCNGRINLLDEELLSIMREAGCNSLKIGIESGSPRILKLMKKVITVEQIKNQAKVLNRSGIHWTGYFIMGLPTETKEEIYATLRLMKEIKPDFASLSVYEPFPGTELFELGIKMGLVTPQRNLKDFYRLSPKYYYVRSSKRQTNTMNARVFRKLELDIKNSFHRYNSAPQRLLKRLKTRSKIYLKEPLLFLKDFKKFLGWITPQNNSNLAKK